MKNTIIIFIVLNMKNDIGSGYHLKHIGPTSNPNAWCGNP